MGVGARTPPGPFKLEMTHPAWPWPWPWAAMSCPSQLLSSPAPGLVSRGLPHPRNHPYRPPGPRSHPRAAPTHETRWKGPDTSGRSRARKGAPGRSCRPGPRGSNLGSRPHEPAQTGAHRAHAHSPARAAAAVARGRGRSGRHRPSAPPPAPPRAPPPPSPVPPPGRPARSPYPEEPPAGSPRARGRLLPAAKPSPERPFFSRALREAGKDPRARRPRAEAPERGGCGGGRSSGTSSRPSPGSVCPASEQPRTSEVQPTLPTVTGPGG